MRKLMVLVFAIAFGSVSAQQTTNKKSEDKKEAKKVLFVLTSHSQLGDTGEKTGFWIEEFASPYYKLSDKGVKITIATPKGGKAPIDPKSNSEDFQTEATKRYNKDEKVQKLIANTHKLENINASEYDAVFYPGGHGPLWDLAENKNSIAIIENFNKANKPIGLVCHAPAALKNTKKENGEPLVKGRRVTGFTNSEEKAVQLTDVVPFLVEDMLKENGGIYSKGADWQEYVLVDGNLITGQNPASSGEAAEKLYMMLK
ncbi:type 1 glutamine amidotransferase domain-containing protein [Christiangramia salexigens]|uniref:Type 1 glutamine amidotransferase domain-containing protein n=1 Tax=Christiangramia salexigens TaxID=1913577 RepID=A0A1L3J463_9FLAO|nr:type 1 glutamine amidotransferase domain-containing protein [Christiangramia salexigens]APG59906.1 type 1 glutamine amidotransferase domain-containing protein [Christiangramia salexigens]